MAGSRSQRPFTGTKTARFRMLSPPENSSMMNAMRVIALPEEKVSRAGSRLAGSARLPLDAPLFIRINRGANSLAHDPHQDRNLDGDQRDQHPRLQAHVADHNRTPVLKFALRHRQIDRESHRTPLLLNNKRTPNHSKSSNSEGDTPSASASRQIFSSAILRLPRSTSPT